MNFWNQLAKPILGLAPMDGVTDAACRYIMAKYGKPDVIFTEFCSIDGLIRDAHRLMKDFIYDECERPIVAQIYGNDPEAFYDVAIMVCELGFDGLDVNMGCPAKSVANRGCGAGLIRTPDLAKQIIRACKQAVTDWTNGKNLSDTQLGPKVLAVANEQLAKHPVLTTRKAIPVTVKTRIGFDKIIIKDWIQHLLEAEPVVISVHGRTLKQMYQGAANWDAIAEAAEICHQNNTLILGNGDIQNLNEASARIKHSGVDGVLLGRGAMGNPWLFRDKAIWRAKINDPIAEPIPSAGEIFSILLEHSQKFETLRGNEKFFEMRKHLGWYARGFRYAKDLRVQLFSTKQASDVAKIIEQFNQVNL